MVELRKAPLYTSDGTQQGEVDLDPEVFAIEPNVAVMHQVVSAQRAAARAGSHSTKTRAEVRGGGRKPWRQKGFGRARHGSIRSPQWVGGGVAHGPRPRDYGQRTPRKMRRLALRSALSARAQENEIKVVEGFAWDRPSTKQAREFLDVVGAGGQVLLVIGPSETIVERSFRNLPKVHINYPGQVHVYDVLRANTVIFTADTLVSPRGAKEYEVAEDDFVREEVSE